MKIIDLTQLMTASMPVYPGTEPPHLTVANTYETDGFRETLLSFFSHTGTHMDAPFHLFGDRTKLNEMPAAQFVGKALVISCMRMAQARKSAWKPLLPSAGLRMRRIFFFSIPVGAGIGAKRNISGTIPFPLRRSAAMRWKAGKKGLGFDTIGIDPIADEGLTRHRLLLSQRDIVIIENLTNLDKIGGGLFLFAALPLKYGKRGWCACACRCHARGRITQIFPLPYISFK